MDNYPQLDDIIDKTINIYRLCPECKISLDEFEKIRKDFIVDEAREITDELAAEYTRRVFKNFKPDLTIREALVVAGKMYFEMTRPLAPILASFWRSVESRCEEDGIERILFAANDANPLYISAKKLRRLNLRIELVDLGRSLFSIQDEISRGVDIDKNNASGKYEFGFALDELKGRPEGKFLESLRGNDERTAFVDCECYGSIVRILLRLNWRLSVFLLTSNNPFLHGYLNKLTDAININKTVVTKDMPWLIGDTIESFPRPYKITSINSENGRIVIKGKKESWFFGACGIISYWCFNQHSAILKSREIDVYESLKEVNKMFKSGSLPCLLPYPMPEWKKAGDFIQLWLSEGLGFVHPQSEVIANVLLKRN